jgi:hypothetical protein
MGVESAGEFEQNLQSVEVFALTVVVKLSLKTAAS